MNFLKSLYLSATSFEFYFLKATEPRRKAFAFFLPLMLITSLFCFPFHYQRQVVPIIQVLEKLANSWVPLEMKNYEILPHDELPKIIIQDPCYIAIDPETKRNEGPIKQDFSLIFGGHSLEVFYRLDNIATFAYKHPLVRALLKDHSNIDLNGNGWVQPNFFNELKIPLEHYWTNAMYYLLTLLFLFSLGAFFSSLFAKLYCTILTIPASWKEIRNISYYALGPVCILMFILYLFRLNMNQFRPLLFFCYILFFNRALHQLQIISPDEEI